MIQGFVVSQTKGLKVFIKGNISANKHLVTLWNKDKPTSLVGRQTDKDSADSSLDDVLGVQVSSFIVSLLDCLAFVNLGNNRTSKDSKSSSLHLFLVVENGFWTALDPFTILLSHTSLDWQQVHDDGSIHKCMVVEGPA